MVAIATPDSALGLRTPPHSIESEQSVIGGLLLSSAAFDRVDFLRAEHFYRIQHREIFTAIASMIERGQPVDATLLAEHMQANDETRSYLHQLALNTPSAANIRRYAEIVRDRWLLRGVLEITTQAASEAYDGRVDAQAIAEAAETRFLALLDAGIGPEAVTIAQAVGEAVDARDKPEQTIAMGYRDLDRMLKGGGLKAGQLGIIAGRPGQGKSALAWGIAEHVAGRQHAAYFTLEMSRRELVDRALAYHEQRLDQSAAVHHLMNLGMTIDEAPAVTVGHIRLRCRRLKRKHGLGLIVVDYLQLMRGQGENRTQEIGSISRGLKALAKELQVPVIAVAQINRGVEQRQDKRPMLSDLRESGDIEADADLVLMLYREEYYAPDTAAQGLAEAIIRKQRSGPTGTVYLRFEPELTRFHAWEREIPTVAPRAPRRVENFSDFKRAAGGDA